jgi:hypothetical protein
MPFDDLLSRFPINGLSLEWIAVFSFIAFAVIYFLAPVLGYAGEHRGMLLVSLYALLGYGLLALLQIILLYLIYLGSSNNMNSAPRLMSNLNTIFAILKLLLLVGSQG